MQIKGHIKVIKNILDMSSKGLIAGVVLVAVVLIGGLWFGNNRRDSEMNSNGNLYVGITDASADIENVNDINMKIRRVELRNSLGEWVTISANEKAYDLLGLKASEKTELYAKGVLAAGDYDRVRVTLGDVIVNTKAKGNVQAVLPASEVALNSHVSVRANQDSHLELDFLADKSLHAAVGGKYVFAPVVKQESRSNASVTLNSDNTLAVSGGSLDSTSQIGVDLNGTSRDNFVLSTDNSLAVQASAAGSEAQNVAVAAPSFVLGGKTYLGLDNNIMGQVTGAVTTEQLQLPTPAGIPLDTNVNTNTNLNINGGTNGGAVNGSGQVNTGVNLGL
jgi:hypothetical protein